MGAVAAKFSRDYGGFAGFAPETERIATFDNDGTLWAEQPMYFQLLFALDRVKALAPMLHHTDAEREWAYDRNSSVGRLDKALIEAEAKGWTVVDMKNDWKTIFPFGSKREPRRPKPRGSVKTSS
jgi:hypothetical protein